MKILSRYLFMNLLKPLLYLLLAFTLLFIVADLTDTLEDFIEAGSSPTTIVHYYMLLIPSLLIYIVPLCLLLATLYSLSTLTRHSEIVAMRASGVNIYRIVRPYLLMGFLCFLFTAFVNEFWGPQKAYRADQLMESESAASEDTYFERIPLENPTLGHSWYIQSFDTRTATMRGIELWRRRPDGSDRVRIKADKGQWLDGRWWFTDGFEQQYDKENNPDGLPKNFDVMEMRDLPEVPEDFMGEAKEAKFLSSLNLRKYIDARRHLSEKTLTKYEVDFHHKLTMPFICIIAAIIGIPVGAHTGRKGALAGILLAIGMFFGFYLLQFTMLYLAKRQFLSFYTGPPGQLAPQIDADIGNYIPVWPWSDTLDVVATLHVLPWVGAWSAVIVFILIGSTMIHRMR